MPDMEAMFHYLDRLRESGITNMFGAGPYLMKAFDLTSEESHDVLSRWMDRPPKQEVEEGYRVR